jgi:hypothetical protein
MVLQSFPTYSSTGACDSNKRRASNKKYDGLVKYTVISNPNISILTFSWRRFNNIKC